MHLHPYKDECIQEHIAFDLRAVRSVNRDLSFLSRGLRDLATLHTPRASTPFATHRKIERSICHTASLAPYRVPTLPFAFEAHAQQVQTQWIYYCSQKRNECAHTSCSCKVQHILPTNSVTYHYTNSQNHTQTQRGPVRRSALPIA